MFRPTLLQGKIFDVKTEEKIKNLFLIKKLLLLETYKLIY